MKKILLLTGLACAFMSFTPQTGTDGIVQAFKSGSAEEVSKYFDDFIDLKLLDKDEVKNMGRNQATIMLRSFFTENGIKGFEKVSEREIGNTMYMTGKLQNSSKGFNITIMLKQKAGKHEIITIRIN
jgi:glycine cleavage system protein P-like pyridoxal-binding family